VSAASDKKKKKKKKKTTKTTVYNKWPHESHELLTGTTDKIQTPGQTLDTKQAISSNQQS
jgi:hypothetical protein